LVMYHVARLFVRGDDHAEGDDAAGGTMISVGGEGHDSLESLRLRENYGLYGHRVLGRTQAGDLIVEETPRSEPADADDDGGRAAHRVRARLDEDPPRV
ncbi:MAG TPA: hypothetical protein VK039_06775, partial [Brevibacterium sp.]|nr:hypothetical protein [Brevibacterium sp.]